MMPLSALLTAITVVLLLQSPIGVAAFSPVRNVLLQVPHHQNHAVVEHVVAPKKYKYSTSLSTPRSTITTSRTALSLSTDAIATGLGYVVGAGSLALYTPIAIRLVRQGSANGLVANTWWLKLASYTCSDLYFLRNHYPVSTYVETLVITAEAAIILGLVSYYQGQAPEEGDDDDEKMGNSPPGAAAVGISLYTALSAWGFSVAPLTVIALGQAASSILNAGALLPQFALNARTKSSGDYSPVTAALATAGCGIRIFTTFQLAQSDPILLGTYGLACLLNGSLLAQIMFYGVTAEGKSIPALLLSDFVVVEAEDDDDDDELVVEMDMKNTKLFKESKRPEIVVSKKEEPQMKAAKDEEVNARTGFQ